MKFFEEWAKNAYLVITDTNGFFKKMKAKGGYKDPLMFAVFNSMIAAFLTIIQRNYFPNEFFEEIYKNSYFFNHGEIVFVMYAVATSTISLYLLSGLEHAVLRVLGAKRNLEATFRVNAYITAFNPLMGLAYFLGYGGLWIMMIVFFAIELMKANGYKKVHDIGYFRALVAVFIIPIAMVMIMAVLIALIIFMALVTGLRF